MLYHAHLKSMVHILVCYDLWRALRSNVYAAYINCIHTCMVRRQSLHKSYNHVHIVGTYVVHVYI